MDSCVPFGLGGGNGAGARVDGTVGDAVAAARSLASELAETPAGATAAAAASVLRTLAEACEAAERRWIRLLFDLHDGPLQHVGALMLDASYLRRACDRALPRDAGGGEIAALADEFVTRLEGLDAELREIAASVGASSLRDRPLLDAIAAVVDDFTLATDVPVALEVEGDFTPLTLSQKIALFRVTQGALANIRRHADATAVAVTLRAEARETTLRIEDDGRGFDVDEVLAASVERGRMGVTAMRERVRLLGGRFELRSNPGGPTVITANLRRWGGAADDDESTSILEVDETSPVL